MKIKQSHRVKLHRGLMEDGKRLPLRCLPHPAYGTQ